MPQASDLGLVDEKIWEQLSKTKGNLKDGTPSNHLEERGIPRF